MNKIIHAQSGHTLYVESISFDELPENVQKFEFISHYPKLYVVKNWNKDGIVFMYIGAGSEDSPKEYVVWYSKGGFWSSFGKNIKDAINGAQSDGWMHA